jgi:hypothetical protein
MLPRLRSDPVDVSEAYGRSDHWDPGPGFPVESFLDRVRTAQQRARAARTSS